ncbi:MAG: hypothetical protein WA326_11770 [Nitrososphaeraceae archaeon]
MATVPDTDHYNKRKKITGDEASDIRNLASDKQVIHQKMQLWTNKEENEYAIRLILTNNDSRFASVGEEGGGDEFIASTDPNAEYTHPIAETDHFGDLQHGWDYALREFINNYEEERLESVKISTPTSTTKSSSLSPSPSNITIGDLVADDKNEYPIKSISSHKCTYCAIIFDNEEERKKHELALHI